MKMNKAGTDKKPAEPMIGATGEGKLNRYSFAEDSPPITVPRALLVRILNRIEMARDHVEWSTSKRDEDARDIIATVIALLEA